VDVAGDDHFTVLNEHARTTAAAIRTWVGSLDRKATG